MASNIIRHVSADGVEFFTVRATGESGMSKSGLALFCGVSKVAVSKLFKRISALLAEDVNSGVEPVNQNEEEQAFPILNSLRGKALSLLTSSSDGSTYSNVDIVPDQVCSVVIMHYAYEAAKPTLQAKKSLILFSSVGLRAYIHAQTGWSAEGQNVRAYLSGLILDEPKGWDEHYSAEWRMDAERITTWRWNDRVMGKFLNECIYSYFPQEMRDRLNTVNPLDDQCRRPNKHHQHFDGEACEALQAHIKTVHVLMQVSTSLPEFRRLMASKFHGEYQLGFGI